MIMAIDRAFKVTKVLPSRCFFHRRVRVQYQMRVAGTLAERRWLRRCQSIYSTRAIISHTIMHMIINCYSRLLLICVTVIFVNCTRNADAEADSSVLRRTRDIVLSDSEHPICVNVWEPTEFIFPHKVLGGYRGSKPVAIERKDNVLVLFANDRLGQEGWILRVCLDSGKCYRLRLWAAPDCGEWDEIVRARDPEL